MFQIYCAWWLYGTGLPLAPCVAPMAFGRLTFVPLWPQPDLPWPRSPELEADKNENEKEQSQSTESAGAR